jgi:hypothetical protein
MRVAGKQHIEKTAWQAYLIEIPRRPIAPAHQVD